LSLNDGLAIAAVNQGIAFHILGEGKWFEQSWLLISIRYTMHSEIQSYFLYYNGGQILLLLGVM